ncbi:PDDEXK family nuclease [Arachidicoccus terrestris]|uniref:hypothetical protein n=1 Tax=Arachidicoccus terrestris TaxID=2875539 RepID=UPI001CC81B9A|nr:hypothetical protein [Arachidicoccus terrestris]UAY55694.1 hypothetical protein K9M52_01280 [Arachidicoccus terrestris]
MKVISINILNAHGDFASSPEFLDIQKELTDAIEEVTWGNEKEFWIKPEYKGNGVKPIRHLFIDKLTPKGWQKEIRMSFANGMNPGPIDAIRNTKFGVFAVEWETGNISSSHRALNKIAVGIIQKQIVGGFLILPVREMSRYLTDRIGNYEEIEPYFPMYENLKLEGTLGVISVSFDSLNNDSPLIPKGIDGNATKIIGQI